MDTFVVDCQSAIGCISTHIGFGTGLATMTNNASWVLQKQVIPCHVMIAVQFMTFPASRVPYNPPQSKLLGLLLTLDTTDNYAKRKQNMYIT